MERKGITMYRAPKNKAERLELRKTLLESYTVKEYPEADCIIGTKEVDGMNHRAYYLIAFDGTAGKPSMNYWYKTAEGRQAAIDRHIADRIKTIKLKEERKQAKNAAGRYTIDTSKPYFEVGRTYSMSYYSDDPWEHTATIRIVKRTACFVTLVHCYGDREDTETERVKVSCDKNGEYISWGSFYYFHAYDKGMTKEEQEEAERQHQQEEENRLEEEQAEVQRQTDEGRKFILDTAEKHPIRNGDPVLTIRWSEHPAFYSWEDDELKLSIAAAEIILKTLDDERNASGELGYDKTAFAIEYSENGEQRTYKGRYDLGDGDGGLIQHIKKFGEYQASHPNKAYSKEDGQSITDFADYLARFTADGIISSVTFAPWLEGYAKRRTEAIQEKHRQAEQDFEDLKTAVEILTDEQVIDRVFSVPFMDAKKRDVGRFFLQELMRRDTCKAFKVFSVWKSGGTLEDLNL